MSGQYFENNENLKSDVHKIDYYYKDKIITLYSDNGVFSKDKIDFGSNLLLKSLNIVDGLNVLDVGCGYGTLGLTIAKYYPNSYVEMVDVNERAIELTKKGIETNKLSNVKVYNSSCYENVNNRFDLIVTNPPIRAGKKIVHEILKNGYNYLNNGGCLICVIQKKQGAPSALKLLEEVYEKVEIINSDKGYLIIKSEKIN